MRSQIGAAAVERSIDASSEPGIGESRRPPAAALIVFMALNIGLRVWLPNQGAIRLPWLLPTLEAVLLGVLIAGPGRLAEGRRWLRPIAVALVCVLVAAALWRDRLAS